MAEHRRTLQLHRDERSKAVGLEWVYAVTFVLLHLKIQQPMRCRFWVESIFACLHNNIHSIVTAAASLASGWATDLFPGAMAACYWPTLLMSP